MALLVPSATSRNAAEKYTASSPICSMMNGGNLRHDPGRCLGGGHGERESRGQRSGEHMVEDRRSADSLGDGAEDGWEGGGEVASRLQSMSSWKNISSHYYTLCSMMVSNLKRSDLF